MYFGGPGGMKEHRVMARAIKLIILAILALSCGDDMGVRTVQNDRHVARSLSNDVLLGMMPGQSGILGANNNPALAARWTDNHPGMQLWWGEDATNYYAGVGPADADGAPENEFVPCAPYDQGGMRAPPDLGISRVLWEVGIRTASVRYAQGSVNIFSAWNPSNPGAANLYEVATNGIKYGLAHPTLPISRQPLIVFVSIIGEQDANSALHSGVYDERFIDIIDHLNVDFADYDRRFILVRLSSACNRQFVPEVRAMEEVIATQRDVVLVESSDLPLFDGLHRSPANNMILAERVAGVIRTWL